MHPQKGEKDLKNMMMKIFQKASFSKKQEEKNSTIKNFKELE